MSKIVKRDGTFEIFDRDKIKIAVAQSYQEVGNKEKYDEIMTQIDEFCDEIVNDKKVMKVQNIQDKIENILMDNKVYDVAKQYIIYRNKQEQITEIQNGLISVIDGYVNNTDWRVKENSNMGYSLQGLTSHIASHFTSKYWLDNIYDEEIKRSHESGYFHIHDLGFLSSYCCGYDIKDILLYGFSGVPDKIECKPPKHLRTVLGQIVNFLYTLQGESAGAQAFSSFDTYLAPFVRYDNLSREEVKIQLESFLYNMNIPTRTGFQAPFTNVTMDLFAIDSSIAHDYVIVGGKYTNDLYKDFQEEMDLINSVFVEVMNSGDAKGRPFSFPIPTYNITKNLDWDNAVVNEVFQMASRYGTPYFANYVNSDMNPSDARSMCCFAGNTRVKFKHNNKLKIDTLRNLSDKKGDIKVYNNGKWVNAKPVVVDYSRPFYKITLNNGMSYTMTDDHINVTDKGDVATRDLKVGDYLKYDFNTEDIDDGKGSYELGWIIGMYIAEGSYMDDKAIQFSINGERHDIASKIENFISKYYGGTVSIQPNGDNSISVFVNSIVFRRLIENFISGKAKEKHLINYYDFNKEMFNGIFDGWKEGDGSKNDIYTSSEQLAKQMLEISSLLSIPTKLRVNNSIKNINGVDYDSTIYTVYMCNVDRGIIYKNEGNSLFCKIVDITKVGNSNKKAFCVEIMDDEPYFTLSNGLVTHNCRLRLDNRELQKRGGGLFGSNPLTGSIGVVTLNLPRIAYESKGEKKPMNAFFEKVRYYMSIAKDSLEIKRKIIERHTDDGLYPYNKFYLRDVKNKTGKYWGNHFSTIGLIGSHEACLNLFGYGIEEDEGKEFIEELMDMMREELSIFQSHTGNNYNLEATPGESTMYKLAKKDISVYPDIIVSGEDEPYYTNSSQLPVDYTDDLFELIEHQDSLQSKYTGGTVLHVYNNVGNLDGITLKNLINKITSSYEMPYISYTPSVSVCSVHGRFTGEIDKCPECGNEMEIYTRVVGYYRSKSKFNKGKIEEFKDRKYFNELKND